MRQTPEQLNAAAAQALAWQQKKEEMTQTLTQQHADSVSKVAVGGYLTNPEIKASVGLANAGVSGPDIHQTVAKAARGGRGYVPSSSLYANTGIANKADGTPYSLIDLFRVYNDPVNRRNRYSPDWYEAVDPNGYWRNLEIPEKITSAKDLLNLNEAQVVKAFLSTDYESWNKIPGMTDTGYVKGERVAPFDYQTWQAIRAKFPTYAKLSDTAGRLSHPEAFKDPTIMDSVMAELGPSAKLLESAVALPFKVAGFFAPDFLKPVANTAKGAIRGITSGFVAGGQAMKGIIEYGLTHPNGMSNLVAGPTILNGKDYEDFKNTVIYGNILTQIARQVADPNQPVDLGTGFFPEGKSMQEAIKAHDAGLPKINGQTWTAGRAAVEPLIKENWIDRNGTAAKFLSGLVDATFTVATDPSLYFDPVQSLMKAFNLDRVAATTVLDGAKADKVREAWAAERAQAGQSAVINEVHDMVLDPNTGRWSWGGSNIPAEDIPKFGGILPAGSQLPEDVQRVVDELAAKELKNAGPLAALDAPPNNLPYRAAEGTRDSFLHDLGVIDMGDGHLRPDPMAIDNMINTKAGMRALTKLASYPNAGALYDAFLGNLPPGAAVQIQTVVDAAKAAGTAVDLTKIHKILVDGVLSADPMFGVQYVPSYGQQVLHQTGKQVAYYANKMSRQLATMPGSTFFSFDDPISSVNDMNKIMTIMKVPTADRHAFFSRALDAVVNQGPGARFDLANDWMKTVVTPALQKNGVPQEWIDTVTKWAGWSDRIHQWSMDAIGRGYPTPWLKDGTGEVLRTIDTLNSGFLMVPPDQLKQVIRETTNLWKAFQPFRGNPAVERILRETVTKKLENIQQQWLKPVAMGAPLPYRMVAKILPDEGLRVAATGHMGSESMVILSTGGHLNYTTHGEVILSTKEITKLFPIKEHLDDLAVGLDRAVKAGDAALANDILAEIAKIEAKHGTTAEIEAKIATYRRRADQALPGANRKVAENIEGLMARERLDPNVMRYERNLNVQQAYKDTNPEKWVTGTSRDLVRMSMSKAYPQVAEALLSGSQQALLDLPQRFLSGDLRPVLNDLVKAFGNANPQMPLDSLAGITEYVKTVIADISTRTGMDKGLLEAVQTGKIGGSGIASNMGSDLWDATSELKTYVRDNLLPNPATDDIPAPFHSTDATKTPVSTERMFTKLFSVYRDTSAKYARNPLMFYEKWKRIIELIPIMDPVEAEKMLKAIDKTDAPEYLKDSIRRAVPMAKGTATRDQVELLGEMHGHQRVSDVLYDFSKKSYFGSKHNMLFGFFDAWFEQWSVWARQIAEQPSLLAKGRLAKEGLTNTGILFKDEDSGQQMVAVPFSQDVYKWLGLNAEERIATKNLSLLSQAVPGLFGFGAIAFDSVAPKDGPVADLRNLFFKYGDPQAQNKIADYIAPAWLQGIVGAAARQGAKKVPGGLDLFDNVAAFLVGQQDDRLRATTLNAVLTNIASNSNQVPLSIDDREKVINDTNAKSDWLLLLKSFFRIVSPTASLTKYFTDLGSTNVTAGVVMDDLRKFQNETPNYADAVTKLLDKYGNDAWIYLAGASDSIPGMAPTKEYAAWYKNNPTIVNKFPLAGGYLGPQGGDYDPTAYSEQRAAGFRKPRDIASRQERALNNLAWSIYKNTANKQIREQAQYGLSEDQVRGSAEFKATMKAQAEELKKLYPTWDPSITKGESGRELLNQLIEVQKMVKNKAVLKTPAGQALKEYWDYRTRNVDTFVKTYPDMANNTWRESPRSVGFRAGLEQMGEYLAYQTPDFKAIWDNVLSREFTPSELG